MIDIEKYKEKAVENFMLRSRGELKKYFRTERICWALAKWTYSEYFGLEIESENELVRLGKVFRKVKDGSYRFPDIIIFKNTELWDVYIGRHAGIMLGEKEFIHAGFGFDGIQITRINRPPWRELPYIVIRHTGL